MSITSTTHPVTPEELMALLDGELPADRAQSVSAHTESCAECQQTFASLLRTARSLTSWSVGQVPPKLEDLVFAKSATASDAFPASGPRPLIKLAAWSRERWVFGLAACAGAFLFLVVGSTLMAPRYRVSRDMAAETRIDAYLAAPRAQTKSVPASTAVDVNGPLRGSDDHAQDSFSLDGQPSADKKVFENAVREVPSDSLQRGPMIARTVSLAILVKDFDANRKSLDSILVRYNGYAASLTVSTPQGAARSLQASLRIPALQLSAALAELKALGHVENENQNGEEVTQQHADLVARLKNSRETEQRLQAILVQRTGKISDVLEVEQEIARVRGEIEQMEAEQKNLEHRVDFATIDLRLSEEYKVKLDSAVPSFSTQFHNALVNGYRNVADTLVALILFFAEYGPILLFWIVLLGTPAWLGWRRWRQAAAAAPAL